MIGEVQIFIYVNLFYVGQVNVLVNVLVVEDFKCFNCKFFEEMVVFELWIKYVGIGKVKMYLLVYFFFVDCLFEDDSKYVVQVVCCVYVQGKNDVFNIYKEILFCVQGLEIEVWVIKLCLKELVISFDIDQVKFVICFDNDEIVVQVEIDK